MARADKISRFLPICFNNGTKVRRFSKHCPRCHSLVSAESMHGIASLMDDKIFVSAKGQCPICHKRFPVACVITNNRHVHRVLIPDWMFAIWLRLAVRNLPQPVHHQEWEMNADPLPVKQGLVISNTEDVLHSEEVIGQFDGIKISSWIEYQGVRYEFERAVPPGGIRLAEDEVLFDGKLIYQLSRLPQGQQA